MRKRDLIIEFLQLITGFSKKMAPRFELGFIWYESSYNWVFLRVEYLIALPLPYQAWQDSGHQGLFLRDKGRANAKAIT